MLGRPASSGLRTERAALLWLLRLWRRASRLREVPYHLVELTLRDLAARIPSAEDLGRAVVVPVSSVHRVAPPAPSAPAPEQASEQEEQEEDEDEEPEREEEEREVPESRGGPDDRPDDDSDHNCDADQQEEPCDPPTDEPSMPIPVMIRLHACHGGCHREVYCMGGIYAYRISDTGKPIRMVRDKYRLSDSIPDAHVSSFSLDDAPSEGLAHVDHLDSRERTEERCGDHGRDRNDDAGMVDAVARLCVSVARPDDAGRPTQEKRRWPVRADREGEGRARVAVRDAGPQAANG